MLSFDGYISYVGSYEGVQEPENFAVKRTVLRISKFEGLNERAFLERLTLISKKNACNVFRALNPHWF